MNNNFLPYQLKKTNDTNEALATQLAEKMTVVNLSGFPKTGTETDDSGRLQRAINYCVTNNFLIVKYDVDLDIGSTTISLPSNVVLEGNGIAVVRYSGTGSAFKLSGGGANFINGGFRNFILKRKVALEFIGIGIDISISAAGDLRGIETGSLVMNNVHVDDHQYGIKFTYIDNTVGFSGQFFEKVYCKNNSYGFAVIGNSSGYTSTWFNVNNFINCEFSYNQFAGFFINYLGSVYHLNFTNCIFSVNGQNAYTDTTNEVGGFFSKNARVDVMFNNSYFEFNYLFRKATSAEITNFTTNGTTTELGTYIIGNEEYAPSWAGIFAINLPTSNKTASISVSYGTKVVLNNTSVQNSTRYCYGQNAGTWIVNSTKFSTYGNVIRTIPTAWVILNSKSANEILNCIINQVFATVQYGSLTNFSSDNSQITLIDNSIALPNGSTLYIDSVNGNDANIGSYEKPYKTFNALLTRINQSNVSKLTIILKTGSNCILNNVSYGLDLCNLHLTIQSENSSNKTTLTFPQRSGYSELERLNLKNSYLSIENVNVVFDYVGATNAINYTYAIDTVASTFQLKNCNVNSNNQYLAIQGSWFNTSHLILYSVTVSGTNSIVTKVWTSKVDTGIYNSPMTGWTGIQNQIV